MADANRLSEEARTAADIAARYGLRRMGTRPSLPDYLGQLWSRRHFVRVLATSRAYARNANNYLGQLWAVLNPLLNAGVYYVIFGLVLGTGRGVDNFVAYLIIGVFMFRFTQASVTAGAKSVVNNLNLVRSLHFPRAVLPASAVLTELATLFPVIVVMLLIVLLTGETLTWTWLLLPLVLALQWAFNTGCGFIAARVVASARDLLNLLPFALRLLLYVSGVFFSIESYLGDGLMATVLQYQPVAVYLTLTRACLMGEVTADAGLWLAGAAWALAFLVAGFLIFWRAEETYGRD